MFAVTHTAFTQATALLVPPVMKFVDVEIAVWFDDTSGNKFPAVPGTVAVAYTTAPPDVAVTPVVCEEAAIAATQAWQVLERAEAEEDAYAERAVREAAARGNAA